MNSKGIQIELQIDDLARSGSGVARKDGFVYFVPFTAPGDRVLAEILEVKKTYAFTRLLRVISSSSIRVKPRCLVFGICGGCQWQHIPYELQFKTKQSGVEHALKRVGIKSEGIPLDALAARDEKEWYGYRNRIQVRGDAKGVGFFASGTQTLVHIDQCPIAAPEVNGTLKTILASAPPPPFKAEIETRGREVKVTFNSKHAAQGFRQVHDAQNLRLQKWVLDQFKAERERAGEDLVVLDLFGGAGNLSLGLLEAGAREVYCVDLGSVPDKKDTQIDAKMKWVRSPVDRWLEDCEKSGVLSADFVILDPPREGLGPVGAKIINRIKQLKVKRILAIGCDPDAWAKDVSKMIKSGFVLDRLGVLDLFPQTIHVESLASLRI